MTGKKVFSALVALIMLILVCCSPVVASASFFVADGDVESCPGNTRTFISPADYNYAWLDSVIIRDGSLAVTPLTLYPVTDYPYSLTSDEFITECNNYIKLFYASDTVVQETVMDSLKTVYYTLVSTGKITDSTQDMRAYNEKCGIVYPYTESKFTDIYTLITYVCLNKNLHKLITSKDVNITRGTTIEGAVVRYLATVCNMDISSDVDTIPAFSYLFTEKYVVDSSEYPVSDEPSEEEVYYWVKLQAAEKAGYSVPSRTRYEDLSNDQMEYVTYAYYASILKTRYNTPIDPMELKAALLSGNASLSVPRLVLTSMLDSVSVSYSDSESIKSLFEKAAREGFFELDNEFYTDICSYKMYVPSDCDKVWITAFPVAGQLEDGKENNVSTYLNGVLVANNSTNSVPVSDSPTTFTVKTTYSGRNDSALYKFTVIKTDDAVDMNSAPPINLSDSFSNIAAGISNVLNGAVENAAGTADSGFTFESRLTTYPNEDNGYNFNSESGFSSASSTYPTDTNGEVLTTRNPLELNSEEEAGATVLQNVAEAVKDNPVAVAAPAGLLAVGASAGFMFYRRRKDEEADGTEE